MKRYCDNCPNKTKESDVDERIWNLLVDIKGEISHGFWMRNKFANYSEEINSLKKVIGISAIGIIIMLGFLLVAIS